MMTYTSAGKPKPIRAETRQPEVTEVSTAKKQKLEPTTCQPCTVTAADEFIMEVAAASAKTGVQLKHGGPFGAAVVKNGIFVSVAHNTVLSDKDPTCHAEMNAIRYACAALQTHDLSDCELYTSCEPCPMCWGGIRCSRMRRVYIGVDRFTAADYDFDDKVFYDKVEYESGHYKLEDGDSSDGDQPAFVGKIGQNAPGALAKMVRVFSGIEAPLVESMLADPSVNRTFSRRFSATALLDGKMVSPHLGAAAAKQTPNSLVIQSPPKKQNEHRVYMEQLLDAIREAVRDGTNKEREIFASMIVKDSKVVSLAVNNVLKNRDSTASSPVLAIQRAAKALKTYDLSGCKMYSTMEPDVMSFGAILWARIDALYYGLSCKGASAYGFEEGLIQYQDLFSNPESIHHVFAVTQDVNKPACEEAFKYFKQQNGTIY